MSEFAYSNTVKATKKAIPPAAVPTLLSQTPVQAGISNQSSVVDQNRLPNQNSAPRDQTPAASPDQSNSNVNKQVTVQPNANQKPNDYKLSPKSVPKLVPKSISDSSAIFHKVTKRVVFDTSRK